MRRPSNTKLNAIALYANFVILALIGLVANPLLVRLLGAEAFGIWKACLRILDLTSVADGRATQALKWIVAHQSDKDDVEHKRREVGAAIVIWLIWMPFLLTAVGLAVLLLPHLIKDMAPAATTTARIAAAMLGLNVMLTALLGIPDSVLAGTNQGFRSYVVTTLFLVISNVGMVVAAYLGFGIIGLGAATLAGSLMTGGVALMLARRHVGWWGVRRPSRGDVKRILSFSNWTLVWSLVQMSMLSAEVLLISYLAGPVVVSRYTFTCYVSQFAISICLMTGSAVTPRLGALVGAGNQAEALQLYRNARQAVMALVTIAACGLIMCNRVFVENWAGAEFYLGDDANVAMTLVMVQLALLRFDAQVQDVGLKIAPKVIWGAAGALLGLAIGTALYRETGSLAAMFAGLIIGRLPLNFVFPRQVARVIPQASQDFRRTVVVLAIIAVAVAVSRTWHPQGWTGLVSAGIVSVLLSVLGVWLFVLSRETRAPLLATLSRKRGAAHV